MSDRTSNIDPVDIHVGATMRAFRAAAGVSQTKLATALGITFQQVQKYEKGANRMSASMMKHAADFLHVSVASFFVGLEGEGKDDAPVAPTASLSPTALRLAAAFDAISDAKAKRAISDIVAVLGKVEGGKMSADEARAIFRFNALGEPRAN